MTDWKERAERAEAELARLRALLTRTIDHVSYGSRRSYDGVGGYKMREAASQLLLEIMAALAAIVAPPAQPAEPRNTCPDCNSPTILPCAYCGCKNYPKDAQPADPIEARSRYETAYAGRQLPHTQTTTSEPVQRLSDEQIDAILHEAGVDEFAAIPIEYDRQVARAIESALQPGWRPEWPAFVEYWTHESHLQTFADRERFRAAAKAMLEAAPKATK